MPEGSEERFRRKHHSRKKKVRGGGLPNLFHAKEGEILRY